MNKIYELKILILVLIPDLYGIRFDVCLGGVPVCHDLRGMAAMPHKGLQLL